MITWQELMELELGNVFRSNLIKEARALLLCTNIKCPLLHCWTLRLRIEFEILEISSFVAYHQEKKNSCRMNTKYESGLALSITIKRREIFARQFEEINFNCPYPIVFSPISISFCPWQSTYLSFVQSDALSYSDSLVPFSIDFTSHMKLGRFQIKDIFVLLLPILNLLIIFAVCLM